MANQRVWLTFDLGVRGDYDGLYQWLDEHKAVECGNGVATFEFDFGSPKLPSIASIMPMLDNLKNELKERVEGIETKGRVYVLTLVNVSDNLSPAGVFLFGSRKQSPWDGFANQGKPEPDV